MTRGRAAVTIAALLGVLLLHNLVLLVRNQLTYDRSHRFAVQHEHLEDIAAGDNHPGVRGDAAVRYALQRRIAGASVLISPKLRSVWWLERVSRLEVEVSPVELLLPVETSDALVAAATWSGVLHRGRRGDRPIHLVVVEGERRYVIAQVDDGGPFILLPEARYRELAPEATRRALGWP